MTDEAPVDRLNRLMSEASDAVEAGDLSTAITKGLAAQVVIAGLAEMERSSGRLAGSRRVKWTPEGIDQFIIRCQHQLNASVGVGVNNIFYRQPGQRQWEGGYAGGGYGW